VQRLKVIIALFVALTLVWLGTAIIYWLCNFHAVRQTPEKLLWSLLAYILLLLILPGYLFGRHILKIGFWKLAVGMLLVALVLGLIGWALVLGLIGEALLPRNRSGSEFVLIATLLPLPNVFLWSLLMLGGAAYGRLLEQEATRIGQENSMRAMAVGLVLGIVLAAAIVVSIGWHGWLQLLSGQSPARAPFWPIVAIAYFVASFVVAFAVAMRTGSRGGVVGAQFVGQMLVLMSAFGMELASNPAPDPKGWGLRVYATILGLAPVFLLPLPAVGVWLGSRLGQRK
jgi:hypothetical protein